MENLCKIKEVFKKIYQFEHKLNKELNVTINEAMVLCSIYKTIKCSGDISSDTGISTSVTSRVLLSLEQKGYVTRSFGGNDKRKMMFELTNKGVEKKLEVSKIDFNLDFNIDPNI
jgi:DNA-binding MarR family transcriptional regulator